MKIQTINHGFTCAHCGHDVPAHTTSCRNHCTECLYSIHVDDTLPGDRASTCQGMMYPKRIEQSGKKGMMIIHECISCGKEQPNKAAPDDNMDTIIKILRNNLL